MTRGDVIAVADRAGDFTGKPRPAVVVQSDLFPNLDSIVVCPLTTIATDTPVARLRVEPSPTLPLARPSFIQVDKLTTVWRHRVGQVIGRLSPADMQRLNGAIAVFLGLG